MTYSLQTRQKAWELYIGGGRTLPQIAEDLKVCYGTLHTWHATESWADRRKQIRTALNRNWQKQFLGLITVAGMDLIADHLKISRRLADEIRNSLDREVSPSELGALASALDKSSKAVERTLNFCRDR